jgi:hypothetical protein
MVIFARGKTVKSLSFKVRHPNFKVRHPAAWSLALLSLAFLAGVCWGLAAYPTISQIVR